VSILPVPARVVSSPLQRCVATASVFGVDVEVDERWIELDYGEWDQTPIASLPAETWMRWRSDLDLRPPGGETINELGRRVRDACDSLLDAARDTEVVVVTHVSPFKAAMAWAMGVDDDVCWRIHVSPASVVQIAIRGDRPSLVV
jgi:broad specificity phosphatase PhoE